MSGCERREASSREGRELLLTIIIPCRNESAHIQPFLADLCEQEGIPGAWEVLIADGRSDDGTREIVQEFARENPHVRCIDNPERIVSTGLNRAIQEARGEIILRMDVHTRYAPDYVRCCLEVMESTGADNVGGAARTQASGRTQRAIAAAYASPFGVGSARFHFPDFEGEVDTVPYGCWRRETLLKLGLFDEELVRNQDDELNLRLIRSGGKIWQSARIRSWYQPRTSLSRLFQQYFQYGYWKVAVIRKHRLPASLRHLVPSAFVTSLLGLGLLSIWFVWARLLLAVEVFLYGGFIAVGSCLAARRWGWDLLPLLPLVLACFHFAYGIGFLQGAWPWKRRGSRRLTEQLSR